MDWGFQTTLSHLPEYPGGKNSKTDTHGQKESRTESLKMVCGALKSIASKGRQNLILQSVLEGYEGQCTSAAGKQGRWEHESSGFISFAFTKLYEN